MVQCNKVSFVVIEELLIATKYDGFRKIFPAVFSNTVGKMSVVRLGVGVVCTIVMLRHPTLHGLYRLAEIQFIYLKEVVL